MALVSDDLDKIQSRLHDSGEIWTRAELLRWYQDGYRQLLARSQAVRRFNTIDIPPRVAVAVTYEWELHYVKGPARVFTIAVDNYQVTYRWEVEQHEGVTPSNSGSCKTYEWELSYGTETDRHYQFYLEKNHERIKAVWWDDKRLYPSSVRELDALATSWFTQGGRPMSWLQGIGKNRTYEIYQIKTAYIQSYAATGQTESGIPRQITTGASLTYSQKLAPEYPTNDYAYTTSGEADFHKTQKLYSGRPLFLTGIGWRFTYQAANNYFTTYIWEKEMQAGTTSGFTAEDTYVGTYAWETNFGTGEETFPVGTIRGASSPDRQYLPIWEGQSAFFLSGIARKWGGSSDALLVLEVVIPQGDIRETQRPELIPAQMQKYLRYYVLSIAFGREGEGQQKNLALHFQLRFNRGVILFRKMGDSGYRDRNWSREGFKEERKTPPRVRLPPEFERVW